MDWAEAMDRDGFAVVPDVVAPAVVDELIAALDAKGPSAATLERGGTTYAMRDLLREIPEVGVVIQQGEMGKRIQKGLMLVLAVQLDKLSR